VLHGKKTAVRAVFDLAVLPVLHEFHVCERTDSVTLTCLGLRRCLFFRNNGDAIHFYEIRGFNKDFRIEQPNEIQEIIMSTFTAVLHKEDDLYVAECPEVGTVSQGSTVEDAVSNLKEATELYLEEFPLTKKKRAILTTFEVSSVAAS
jgi:predicted RNase H-like HicB family nuclease